jgi:hypothetical protein
VLVTIAIKKKGIGNMTTDEFESGDTEYQEPTSKQAYEIDTTTQVYLQQCVKEGFALLAKEEKAKIVKLPAAKKDPAQELNQKLTADQTNPYVQARINVLLEINLMFKKEVLRMEAEGDTDNRKYQEFVRMVREEGDKLSNNP